MNLTFAEILDDFISLIYPRICLSCIRPLVKGEEILCTGCIVDLPKTNYHLNSQNPLITKLQGRVMLSHALAFLKFRKKGNVQRLLHALKYKGHPEIGIRLGKVYGEEILRAGIISSYDIITSVPLHASRLRQRGYNQSDQWAMGLSETTKIPFSSKVLARSHKTSTQTKRTKLSRWENVKEVFYVREPSSIKGSRVLLVDDVVTTGATLESCSKMLLEADCKSVGIACIAVTV